MNRILLQRVYLNMGNSQICEKCESFQSPLKSKFARRKRDCSRQIIWSNRQTQKSLAMSLKILKEMDGGICQVVYPSGAIYAGEMICQQRDGKGKLISPDGSIYEGDWVKDKMQGYGIYKGHDFTFEGLFENNSIKNGQMFSRKRKKQLFYDGQFNDFMYHGHGRLTIKNYYTYEGSFKFNKKEGQGKIIFNSGEQYEGNFRENAFEGNGKYTTSKFQYIGEFKKGKIHGYGKCYFKDGSFYEGNYENGSKQGYGQYTYQNGEVYKGVWKKGKPFEMSFTFGKRQRVPQQGVKG